MANLNKAYHLDEPLVEQYGRYLWGVLHFDFGPSFKYRDYTVSELIFRGFPISLQIGLWAVSISAVIGIALGSIAALRQNTMVDYVVMSVGMGGIAVPTFVTAPLLQLLFAVNLHWLPVAGWDGHWQQKVLPIAALSLPSIAVISRLTRGSMIESLRSNHVRTARAKGLGIWLTVTRHALLGGAAADPRLSRPGDGRHRDRLGRDRACLLDPRHRPVLRRGRLNRDYTLVMGTVIFYGMLIIVANLLVDLTYSLVDRRSAMSEAALRLEPNDPGDSLELEVPRSQLRDGFARLRKNRAAVVGMVVVPAIALACIVGPWFVPFDPNVSDFDAISVPPLSGGHVFGTDDLGRDLLVRILVAGRTSLRRSRPRPAGPDPGRRAAPRC